MNVEVWFHGTFEQLAVRKRVVDLADDARLGDLIDRLGEEYGPKFTRELARPQENYVMLNGTYCKLPVNREQLLKQGDVVAFLPVMAGG